jgi:hypothetical protein
LDDERPEPVTDLVTNYDTRILTFASVHRVVALDQVKVLLHDRAHVGALEALIASSLSARCALATVIARTSPPGRVPSRRSG